MTRYSATTPSRNAIMMFVGMMLVALNLRPALTSVGPVLKAIGDSLSLSSIGQGVLTTLPVLLLGLAAPMAPYAARRLGMERTVLAALIILALAMVIRPFLGVSGLFLGTAVAGGCIGIMSVLLPGIVKRDFPESASLMTGLYTAVLCTGAAVAAGATEPLRIAFSNEWQPALAFWTVPAIIAAVAWWLQLDGKQVPATPRAPKTSLFRDGLAWQVAFYMGLQSSLAYTVFGWLPTILQDRGIEPVTAGLALSVSILVQVPTAIAAPWIASHMRDQRAMVVLVMLATLTGITGSIYAPIEGVWFWVVILGLGQGGSFSIALTLLAVRARDTDTAARLSGMAQSVGYTMAALGPLLVGVLHERFESWNIAGLFLGLIALGAILAGLGAGRQLYVLEPEAP
ncbi:MFS transporter [Marinobacter adhaerens]|uniref:MFS transporter n=1 Tax=Marinobacter adhaerens TaxID=1033846 RepID=A0A851HQ45_9GAMM|nr:MFS transporter [Marinobacter adhaerens]NWN91869.1 MFS transporter [Marinobacter adhaerens]